MIMQRLSLLARGTRYRWRNAELLVRFIPAGAGNTPRRAYTHHYTPVYPRWRGEHLLVGMLATFPDGLSPLARGTRIFFERDFGIRRFIPAGAGNTAIVRAPLAAATVYPRWRGEHAACCRKRSIRRRFIPAGAGNTGCNRYTAVVGSVYPRWRGEHSLKNC